MNMSDSREVARRLLKYRKRQAKKQALRCKADSKRAVEEMVKSWRKP